MLILIKSTIKNLKLHTDAELLSRWKQGDESAFSMIYNRYVLDVLAIALDKTKNRSAADELVQDTFIVLYNKGKDMEDIHNLMAFLYVVLKNKVLDWYRKKACQNKLQDYIENNFNLSDDSTRSIIETKDLERILNAEIEKLPSQCKRVFQLRRIEFLPNKEIASRMNISVNTVEQHMRKAIRILRNSLSHLDFFIYLALLPMMIN